MKKGKWEDASNGFKGVTRGSPLYPSAIELSQLSLQGKTLPYKNPALAGIMAGIVPGLGHAYCNRYRDAMVAFLLNGVFILATIEAFDNDLEAVGSILGFLELGWYTGNIYSAINSAYKHNRKLREDFIRRIPDGLGVISRDNGIIGVAVRFSF